MGDMHKSILLFVLSLPGIALCQSHANHAWLMGTWQKTLDEDNSPTDTLTFRGDGTWIGYGPRCEETVYQYFVHSGDVFLILPQPKGPVALIFRPNPSNSKLTFTSPRTRNNAIYEKVANPVCGKTNES